MSKFTIFKGSNGNYYFNLKASNGEKVLSSEGYTSKIACQNGIVSAVSRRIRLRTPQRIVGSAIGCCRHCAANYCQRTKRLPRIPQGCALHRRCHRHQIYPTQSAQKRLKISISKLPQLAKMDYNQSY